MSIDSDLPKSRILCLPIATTRLRFTHIHRNVLFSHSNHRAIQFVVWPRTIEIIINHLTFSDIARPIVVCCCFYLLLSSSILNTLFSSGPLTDPEIHRHRPPKSETFVLHLSIFFLPTVALLALSQIRFNINLYSNSKLLTEIYITFDHLHQL